MDRRRLRIRRWLTGRLSIPAQEIEGVALEVFARLHLEGGDAALDDPQAYLLRLAGDVSKAQKKRARLSPQTKGTPPRHTHDKRARVELVMQELPPCYREALLLRTDYDLPCSQIAQRQGVTRNAVLQKLTKTYTRLRLELDTDVEDFGTKL